MPEAVVIGGSWGGLEAILRIVSGLPARFALPLIVVLHRGRNFKSELESVIQHRTHLQVREVEEKEKIQEGYLYIAPANYHVPVEQDYTFSLDLSAPVHHSRPSIDVTFESAAEVYGPRLVGVLLTGANVDGASGLKIIADRGGLAIIQDPSEAEADTMPRAALQLCPVRQVMRIDQISQLLLQMHQELQWTGGKS